MKRTAPINKAYIFIKGDTSVGIPDITYQMEVYLIEDVADAELERIRKKIAKVYEYMDGEPAKVLFDLEVAEYNRQEQEMFDKWEQHHER